MQLNLDDQRLLTRYLLGQSGQDERDRVEARFFEDDSFYEELGALEMELIRDFVRGGLEPAQRIAFRKHYNSTSALAEKVREVELLVAAAKPTLLSRIVGAFRPKQSVTVWIYALGSLALVGVALTLGARNRELAETVAKLRGETAALRNREASMADEIQRQQKRAEDLSAEIRAIRTNPGRPRLSLSFILTAGLSRSTGNQGHRFRVPSGTEDIRLQLDLPKSVTSSSFRALLSTASEDQQVWNRDGLASQPAPSGKAVIVILDASLLPSDDYVILLQSVAGGGVFETEVAYSFGIVRE